MDKSFNTWLDLNECTVVSDKNNFTLNLVTNFNIRIEAVPRMRGKLFETESDSLLLLVEVEDNNFNLLIEFNNFLRVVYAAPREVCDVDKTVDTTEVNEYTIVGDVLDCSFENLAFFEFADDLALLLLEFSLKKSLVRNDNVTEFLINLNDLEVHCLVNICIVILDRTDVDL